MSPDTPLAEVAHYLGQETAALLLERAPGVQNATLRIVRAYITFLEEKDVHLDPITLTDKLHRIVVLILGGERE